MAWNTYISANGFDTPNRANVTFEVYNKEDMAETAADIHFTSSWDRNGNPSSGRINSFESSDTMKPVPYMFMFDSDGELSRYAADISCNATISAYTSQWNNYTFNAQYLPLNCRSGYNQDVYYCIATNNCHYDVNIPVIAISDAAYSSNEQYITQHRSAWLAGEEDFWPFYNGLVNDGVAQWLNVNTAPPTEEDGEYFDIYNTGQRGTWDEMGVTDISSPFYRWARVKLATTSNIDGRLAFYRQGLDDGVIKLIPVYTASIIACEYSTNGGATWETSQTFPFEYIYGERINELGTFIYATRSGVNGDNGAPIFENQSDANAWVNHDPNADITKSINYGDMVNRYGPTNPTGNHETDTTMGTAGNFKSHFTQKYLLDNGDVVKIANALLDTSSNIFEDIKKGLEMFGEKIIDSVCGLMFFPIDLTTVFNNLQSQSYIFFGGYQWPPTGDPTSITVHKLVNYSGYIDLGEITINKTYPEGDYRNSAKYCRVLLYLPYVGFIELSYEKYAGHTVKIRYYIDINTGSCLVCLLCNFDGGYKLLDYVNGQIGVQIPITLTDYSGFAQAELRNISNMAATIGGGAMGLGSNVAARSMGTVTNALNANTMGALSEISSNIAEAVVGSLGATVNMEKALYDLQTTNINNFKSTVGASGAIGNQYLPQYVYLIFENVRTDETSNLLNLEGKPSNASGALSSFSGYLECDSVKLNCPYATEHEKARIMQLLNSGIYI